ncbi:MAG: TRAP transporter substrate-binding protein [Pseudomonadota bacterium]
MQKLKRRFKGNGFMMLGVIATIMILVLTSAVWATEAKVYKARLSYHWFPEHHSAKMASLFAAECKEATRGRLEIEVFPSGQLFGIRQIVPSLSSGSVEIGGVLDILFIPVTSNFQVAAMPRFFKGFEQNREFWERTPAGKKVWEGVQKKLGIKILAYIPVGPGCYFSAKRPLDSVAAFKGLKARYLMVTEKPSYEAFGTSYVSVSTSEVYTALKQGMIDTLLTVPSAVKAYNWWDYLKYAQQPYQSYHDAYIAVNAKWWDHLPQDIQDIVLTRVAPKISKKGTDEVMAYSDAILKELVEKHGGTVSTLSEAEMKKLAELDRTKIYPMIAKTIDPDFYQAAKKFAGLE